MTALDGTSTREVIDSGDSTTTEDEVVEHGGDAPRLGVDARPTAGDTATDSTRTVTGDGAGDAFCVHVMSS